MLVLPISEDIDVKSTPEPKVEVTVIVGSLV